MAAQQTRSDRRSRFDNYIAARRLDPPRPLLLRAASLAARKEHALDLGAGALNATSYLLSAGFGHITAVDASTRAQELAKELPREQVSFVLSRFEDFHPPVRFYDLVNAEFCLPFMTQADFGRVFPQLLDFVRAAVSSRGNYLGSTIAGTLKISECLFRAGRGCELFFEIELRELEEEDRPGTTSLARPNTGISSTSLP